MKNTYTRWGWFGWTSTQPLGKEISKVENQ